MPEAAAFQGWFVGAITGAGRAEGAPPSFAVYRNTWLKGLLDALGANYPTVAMILGAESFEELALQFARGRPAQTPVLAMYGEGFPDFLARHPVSRDLPYLADVGALERLWTECFFARDSEELGASRFAVLRPGEMLGLRPPLHPATRLARLETPAVTIWQAHRQEATFEEIEPEWTPEHALLTRHGLSISVQLIDETTYDLLLRIRSGRTIAEAIADTSDARLGSDIAEALATVISSGALAAPRLEDERIW